MKISTKARYGLRLMFELALAHDTQLVQVKDVAKSQDLPEKYLEQIIILLRNSGLIKSVRGAKGGYFLARSPEEIQLKEIIESLEGSLYPVECAVRPEACDKSKNCPTTDVWRLLGERIGNLLESISLADLTKDYEHKLKIK